MNPFTTFRDHVRIHHEFLFDDSADNTERYFESADAMDRLRFVLNRFAAVAVGILGIAAAIYNVRTGSGVSIIELAFPALAAVLVFTLVRIGNDLGSKGTREVVATANMAKSIGDQRRASESDR